MSLSDSVPLPSEKLLSLFTARTFKSAQVWYWFSIIWLYAVILLWHHMVAGSLSILVAVWLFSLLLLILFIGDLFQKWVLKDNKKLNILTIKLLSGILCTNALLFVSYLVLPFYLATDYAVLFCLVLTLWYRARRKNFIQFLSQGCESETFCFLIIPLAVTVWCNDLLHPIQVKNGLEIIHAWQDIYYHLCQINAFALSNGFGNLSDVQMAGASVSPYHLASYMLPAVLVNLTGSSTIVAYASFFVPLGIFVTALAAYSLSYVIFGKWPALSASLALIFLPDAAQQGFGNPFLGYHWLQQIAPAQCYGVACAAFVFMLMIEGCSITQYRLILAGYIFVLITMLYKAQIFVAISFVALVFPILFMKGIITRYRVSLLLLLTCIYVSVIFLSQNDLRVPLIRLDGSGLISYSSTILANQADGYIKKEVTHLFNIVGNNQYLRAITFVLMLITCTFGIFSILFIILIKNLKKHFTPVTWLFPLFVVAVYLLMSTCLALDNRHIGTPEELLHRPFVWAYFVLVVWSGGGIYYCLFGDNLPAKRREKACLVSLVSFLAIIPISFGKEIQTYQELPLCQVKAARFIRENSQKDEIIQDSFNDPRFILSGLSERKSFAIDSGGVRAPIGMKDRLNTLLQLKQLKKGDEVLSFMKANAVKWYVVNPMDQVRWADSNIIRHVVFECGGYKVYHF